MRMIVPGVRIPPSPPFFIAGVCTVARAFPDRPEADFRVPILDEAFQYLLELKADVGSEGKIFAKIPPRRWTWLTCHAGVAGLKFHDLRRYFLQRCCRQGVPFDVAMRLGDWRDAKIVLEHYRAIGQDELKKGFEVAVRVTWGN